MIKELVDRHNTVEHEITEGNKKSSGGAVG